MRIYGYFVHNNNVHACVAVAVVCGQIAVRHQMRKVSSPKCVRITEQRTTERAHIYVEPCSPLRLPHEGAERSNNVIIIVWWWLEGTTASTTTYS